MVNVFGRIELDEDETSFLSLGPDFALYEPILRKRAAVDFLAATTKIRWSRMGKPKEEITQLRPKEEIEQEEEIEEQVFLQTRMYNQDTKRIDVSQQGCTDMKTSRRVTFPPGRTAKEEATLEVRTNL